MGGWRLRGSAQGGCITPVMQSDVHRCIPGMAGRNRAAPWALKGEKGPESQGGLQWVKPLPYHLKTYWCCCSHSTHMPKPAARKHPWVLQSPPAQPGEHMPLIHPIAPCPCSGLISSSTLC